MLQTLKSSLRFSNRKLHFSFPNFQNTNLEGKLSKVGWEDKIKFWLWKYENLFGITKLSEMHETVLETQKKIQVVQEKRRKIQEDLFIAQKKLQESRNILHKTAMDDNMYISVVTQVHELLKEQGHLQERFSTFDQTERELQANLAIAINNSQDHERTYREKTKYLSLVTGVVGGLLGFLGSSINNWRLRREIKLFASSISSQVNALQKDVEKLNPELLSTETIPNNTELFLSQMKSRQEDFQNNVKALQSLVDNYSSSDHEINKDFNLDFKFKNMSNQLEADWDSRLKYHTSLNIVVISSLLLISTVLLYVSNSR